MMNAIEAHDIRKVTVRRIVRRRMRKEKPPWRGQHEHGRGRVRRDLVRGPTARILAEVGGSGDLIPGEEARRREHVGRTEFSSAVRGVAGVVRRCAPEAVLVARPGPPWIGHHGALPVHPMTRSR